MSIRSQRIFGLSLFDLILSVICMIILFLLIRRIFFETFSVAPFIISAILLTIPVGIFFHLIFGVNTELNYKLGLSDPPAL